MEDFFTRYSNTLKFLNKMLEENEKNIEKSENLQQQINKDNNSCKCAECNNCNEDYDDIKISDTKADIVATNFISTIINEFVSTEGCMFNDTMSVSNYTENHKKALRYLREYAEGILDFVDVIEGNCE